MGNKLHDPMNERMPLREIKYGILQNKNLSKGNKKVGLMKRECMPRVIG